MKTNAKNFNIEAFVNSEGYKSLSAALKELNSITLGIVEKIKPLTDSLSSYRATLPDFSSFYNPIRDAAKQFSETITKQLENPESVLSYFKYFEALSNFFWVMPYKITPEQIHELIKENHTEKEFDAFMLKHFSDSLLNELFKEIEIALPKRHVVLFKQCIRSFNRKDYAICSIGLYSIIDDLTSYYVKDKDCTSRIGLFKPIVNDVMERDYSCEFEMMDFVLLMMDRNIDDLYARIVFTEKTNVPKNKDTNRNTSVHGKYCSNKRESDLMLFNSIYWLLGLQTYLSNYKNKLKKKKIFKLIKDN